MRVANLLVAAIGALFLLSAGQPAHSQSNAPAALEQTAPGSASNEGITAAPNPAGNETPALPSVPANPGSQTPPANAGHFEQPALTPPRQPQAPAESAGDAAQTAPEAAPTPVVDDPTQALPMVVDARVSATPQRARLVLDLAQPTQFAIASIDAPDRIVVDVRAAGIAFTPGTAPAGSGGIVASYVIEQPEIGRVRATLALQQPAQVQQAYLLEPFSDQPARLVVDLVPATPDEFSKHVADDLKAATAQASSGSMAPGGSNLAGASRPLVVIDPGHGGMDNGATAPNGVHEKDIVLAFALKLQSLIVQSGRFDVALTREDDSFLKLEDRVALARANKADLFISIHADSFQQPDIRGASVYTRDEAATDALDKVLADSENKRDMVAGFVMPEMDDKVVDILVDLMRRETRKQSYIAAQDLVHQLEPSVALRRFPVRQADFLVLQAPDVPSVLVELGFLSNPADIVNLTGNDWRDRTAEALARGITAYFDELQASGTAMLAQQAH